MNTTSTLKIVQELGVVALKADKSRPAPEVDALLVELGNPGKGIPYYAIFPGNGGPPITFGGNLISAGGMAEKLRAAGPSKSKPEPAETKPTTAMNER